MRAKAGLIAGMGSIIRQGDALGVPPAFLIEGMAMKSRARLALLLVCATGAALAAGQNPPPPPQTQQPTFKLQVDYVEVDVVVTDRQGNLVRDLKKEDFQ